MSMTLTLLLAALFLLAACLPRQPYNPVCRQHCTVSHSIGVL